MFRQALKVLFPVIVTLSLTLGALAWSASSVAFAASQPAQSQTSPTATPTPVYGVSFGPGYAAPFYSAQLHDPSWKEDQQNRRDRDDDDNFNLRNGKPKLCFTRKSCDSQ